MSERFPMGGQAELSVGVAALRAGFALSALDHVQLWLGYMRMGGTLPAADLVAALHGQLSLPPAEHDLVARALNEHFTRRGIGPPVAYNAELWDADDNR